MFLITSLLANRLYFLIILEVDTFLIRCKILYSKLVSLKHGLNFFFVCFLANFVLFYAIAGVGN